MSGIGEWKLSDSSVLSPFVFKHSFIREINFRFSRYIYIYLNKDDSKNTLNLIFMFVNFCLKEQSVDLSLTR